MMRNHSAALALAALLCTTPAAAAAPQNGVLSGLSVTWAAVNTLGLDTGEAYVAGNVFTTAPVAWSPFLAANLGHGVFREPNTAYYVYLCWDTSAMVPAFTTDPITETIVPAMGGASSALVQTSTGDNCDTLFLGSFVTDSVENVVPFNRSGEDVILSLVNSSINPCDAGTFYNGAGAVPISFTRTGSACVLVAFDSVNNLSCNGKDTSAPPQNLDLPYPQSASAMLVDWSFTSADVVSHWIDVPYQTFPSPPGPVYLSNYQLNLFSDSPLPCVYSDGGTGTCAFTDYYSHTRVNASIDAGVNMGHSPPAPATTGQFWVCIDGNPDGGPVNGVAFYRGYVESIGHMTTE